MERPVRALRAVVLLSCATAVLLGQTPGASLEGVVVEQGLNRPLARVTLDLRSVDNASLTARYPALTTAEGKFSFRNIPPGRYSLSAMRVGYLRVEYGQRGPNSAGTVVEIRAGQTLRDIRLTMIPTAAISGRVFDNTGEPAVNAQLHAWRVSYAEGWRKLVPVTSQVTNDLGDYRLFGLPPGLYYVSAQPEPRSFVRSPAYASLTPPVPGMVVISNTAGGSGGISDPANSLINGADLAPIYFGGATNEFSAKPILVRAGDDIRGIDIPVERIPLVSINGTVLDSSTRQPVRATLTVTPLAPDVSFTSLTTINVIGGVLSVTPSRAATVSPQGQFRTEPLPQGSYLITAIADVSGQRLSGQAVADSRNLPSDGVRIDVAPGFDVSGQVTFEGVAVPNLKVGLRSTASQPLDVAAVALQANGAFSLRNVPPGRYVVQLPPLTMAYVKSVRLAGINVLDEGLRIDRPLEGRLEIVIAGNTGKVSGTAVGADRQLLAGVTVVLAPDQRQRHDLYRSVSTDPAGRFGLENIPPGRYKLFAWEDVEAHAWLDSTFMSVFEDRGIPLSVDAGGNQTATITTIPLR
jgi:Carboxypeptidase regulatory-like domain